MKMKPLQSLETSHTAHPPRHCHIPEHFYLQQHRCENITFRDLFYLHSSLFREAVKIIIVQCIHCSLKRNFTPLFDWELRSTNLLIARLGCIEFNGKNKANCALSSLDVLYLITWQPA